jgi:hypothetical protein
MRIQTWKGKREISNLPLAFSTSLNFPTKTPSQLKSTERYVAYLVVGIYTEQGESQEKKSFHSGSKDFHFVSQLS